VANPYGMVMGLDGRWEYDPKEYTRSVTNARFRTPFPYMGVGSMAAGAMAQSADAGRGSDIPGIRGPGGAPAWGAGLGASPLYSPSFSTEAVSGVSPTASGGVMDAFDAILGRMTGRYESDAESVYKDTMAGSNRGVNLTEEMNPGYQDILDHFQLSNSPALLGAWKGLDAMLAKTPSKLGISSIYGKQPNPDKNFYDNFRDRAIAEWRSANPNSTLKDFAAAVRANPRAFPLRGDPVPGRVLDSPYFTPTLEQMKANPHLDQAVETEKQWGLGGWSQFAPASAAVDDFSDFQTNPGRYAGLTSVRGTGPDIGFSIGQAGVNNQGVMVPTMTSALQQSINVGASDPNAPAGQVDIDASPTGWATGQALVDRFGNPVTLSNDPQSVAAANYRSFLADKDINVANTIAAALARADEAVAGMGLTGAAAEKASALVSAELGYLSADQLAGLQAAQQEQEAAEQAAAEQAVAAQALADAQAAAAQAVDDFSDYPSQGDYFDAAGNVVSGPAGAPQGAHHAGSAVSKAVDRAVQNAVIDALVNAVDPYGSDLSDEYGDLGYGGGFGEGHGDTGSEGMGGWT